MKLFPHQEVALEWLLAQRRGILADVPGLGKTYPAIMGALLLPPPRLIVVPAYLRYNWQLALEEVEEGLVAQGHSARSARGMWELVSYEGLRLGQERLKEIGWNVCVFDEAHKLRGRGGTTRDAQGNKVHLPHSQVAGAAFGLKTDCLWLLTGTPRMRDIGDLYALLHLIDPAQFSSYWRFVATFATLRETRWDTVVGPTKNVAVLRRVLAPLLLRRTWKEVGIEMPPALRRVVWVEAGAKWRVDYAHVKKDYVGPEGELLFGAGAMVSALYKMTASLPSKLEAVRRLCKEYPTSVVWCWRRDTAEAVAREVGGVLVTGALPPAERAKVVGRWKREGGVLVATMASLAVGENMQQARVCVFYESSWLATDIEQAIGRLRRIGQEGQVLVYHLLVKSTVDEAVYKATLEREADGERVLKSTMMGY